MRRVHLDHNATTPLRPEARERLLEVLDAHGNPSSLHAAGREARQLLDEARERVAGALGVTEDEVIFTSGGTESNNLALGGVLAARGPDAGLVTTAVEHSSVLAPALHLERLGHRVTRVAVDGEGFPDPEELERAAAAPGCALVSVMAANNEVGTLPPLEDVGHALADLPGARPLFHTDAVQALGRIPLELERWDVDLASFSAHKVGGPRGVGILYRRQGAMLEARQFGGEQEGGYRPGTENLAAICAAAVAVECAVTEQEEYARRTQRLCRSFWFQLQAALPGVVLLGPDIDSVRRLPNTLDVSLPDVDGRVLVTRLDLAGLEVSAGSACASGSLEPSHVLLAMGLSPERARAGLRMSLGRNTNEAELCTAVDTLRKTLAGEVASRSSRRG